MGTDSGLGTPDDHARIARQRRAVFLLMRDAVWRTLAHISESTAFPEASVSARLRDFRKEKYGGHTVDRRRVRPGSGLWEYRLLVNVPQMRLEV